MQKKLRYLFYFHITYGAFSLRSYRSHREFRDIFFGIMFIIFAIYGFLVTAENIIGASLFIAWLFYPLILFILDKLGKDIIRFYYEDKK